MSVSELFQSIRKRKVETSVSTFEPYHRLLIAMAAESDFDSHEAEIILDQHGKSRVQFEADIEKMKKRLQATATIEEAREARTELITAEDTIRAIDKERQDVLEETEPKLAAAILKRDTATSSMDRANFARNSLCKTVLDPQIIEREAELGERRKQLGEQRRPIMESLDVNCHGSAASNLAANLASVENWEKGLEKSAKDDAILYCKKQIVDHQRLAGQAEVRVSNAQIQLTELNQKIAGIENELTRLQERKLIP